ncbi:hypothetical protein [Gemelliphila palaticanis]|uniref:Uncharacterized protein n=1 Tax=Gemelliphila palaticanis TaxID=81950 RepID=A0ABX2SXS1_9BACL|nr:hypothetical protein [Gemella palaticanis]MBF0715142.1 hypothetical protein [Gemella palaticanis]NYS47072.1 hypothetical protein [Gemella palaticanis]
MSNIKLVEQISAFKKLSKNENNWRIAFYHIANEFWNMPEHYVVLDKQSVEKGYNLPLIREYKDTLAVQFFTDYSKALDFVERQEDLFTYEGKKLIYKMKKGAFQEVFVPFLASQNLAYMINDVEEHFVDTFERLLAVMEADKSYVVDEEQAELINNKDFKNFYGDVCKKYLIFVG